LFVEAIEWLDWLDEKLPPTGERPALRGSVHKRWAMLTTQAQRLQHLRQSLKAYGEARQQQPQKQSYQILNWLALCYLLKKMRRQPLVALAQQELDQAQQKNTSAGERSFWDRVAVPDARLHVALFQGCSISPRSSTKSTTPTGTRWPRALRRGSAPLFATTWCFCWKCYRMRR
jgi:hypothetical protein